LSYEAYVGNMGKKEIIIFMLSLSLTCVLISGCVNQANDIGVNRQIGDTRIYCTVNNVNSAVVENNSYYLVNVTLQNNSPEELTFTAQDFTLSDIPTDNQDVNITLGSNSSMEYSFYFQKDPINIGHYYLFGCHDPVDIQQSANFNLKLD